MSAEELADTIDTIQTLMIISERSWRAGAVAEDCKNANVTLVFKGGAKELLTIGQHHLYPWKGNGISPSGGHLYSKG